MTCFVYFLQAGDERGAIKIGYSANVEQRVLELRTGNHLPLALLAKFDLGTVQAAAAFEKEMHTAFVGLRLEGEWFEHDVRITETIAVLRMLDARAVELATGPTFRVGELLPSLKERLYAANSKLVAFSGTGDRSINELYVVEWSDRQSCIHIHELGSSLRATADALLRGHGAANDFVILAIVPTYDDANTMAAAMEPTLRAVRAARRAGAAEAFQSREHARKAGK